MDSKHISEQVWRAAVTRVCTDGAQSAIQILAEIESLHLSNGNTLLGLLGAAETILDEGNERNPSETGKRVAEQLHVITLELCREMAVGTAQKAIRESN